MRVDRAAVQPVSEAILRKHQGAAGDGESHYRTGAEVTGDHLSHAEEQVGVRGFSELRVGGGGLMGRTAFFMPRQKRAVRYAGGCPPPPPGGPPRAPRPPFPLPPLPAPASPPRGAPPPPQTRP